MEPRDRSGSTAGLPQRMTEQRDRSGSTSSQKRRREAETEGEEMDIEQEDMPETVDQMREELEDLLYKESSKVSRSVTQQILKFWRQMERICYDKIVQRADAMAENRVLKEVLRRKEEQPKGKSYAQAATGNWPKVGKKVVVPRDSEKVVLVYQKTKLRLIQRRPRRP